MDVLSVRNCRWFVRGCCKVGYYGEAWGWLRWCLVAVDDYRGGNDWMGSRTTTMERRGVGEVEGNMFSQKTLKSFSPSFLFDPLLPLIKTKPPLNHAHMSLSYWFLIKFFFSFLIFYELALHLGRAASAKTIFLLPTERVSSAYSSLYEGFSVTPPITGWFKVWKSKNHPFWPRVRLLLVRGSKVFLEKNLWCNLSDVSTSDSLFWYF